MDIQQVLYSLVQQLIELVLDSRTWFILPLLTLLFVIRFLKWGVSAARGGADADEIAEQSAEYQRRLEGAPGRLRDAARGSFRRRY